MEAWQENIEDSESSMGAKENIIMLENNEWSHVFCAWIKKPSKVVGNIKGEAITSNSRKVWRNIHNGSRKTLYDVTEEQIVHIQKEILVCTRRHITQSGSILDKKFFRK